MEKTNEAKELLKKLDSLIHEDTETKEYLHIEDITKISRKLHSMKLKDEFFIKDLSNEELNTFNTALVLSNAAK